MEKHHRPIKRGRTKQTVNSLNFPTNTNPNLPQNGDESHSGAEQKYLHGGRIVHNIVRIEKKLFPKHESLAKSFEDELRKRNGGLLYKVSDDEEVIGYAMYSFPSSLSASITKLAVKEKHRRRGHGEDLLRAAIDKCRTRKVQRVVLHVYPLMTPALNLYEKVGFKVDGLIEGYYSPDRMLTV